MTNKPTIQTLPSLITKDIDEELASSGYREPAMLAFKLREMLGNDPDRLAPGIVFEKEGEIPDLIDENNGSQRHSLLRVSAESLPYLRALRLALLLERWCDKVVQCPAQAMAKEVSLMWPDVAAWRQQLTTAGTGTGSRADIERGLASVLLPAMPLMASGPDFLFIFWTWLRESVASTTGQGPRLGRISDLAVVEQLCSACLDHGLVGHSEMDGVLEAIGCSPVRVRLALRSPTTFQDGHADELLTPAQAAKLIGITVGALNNKKSRGEIPPAVFVKTKGKAIRYRKGALLRWHRGEL